MKHPTIGGYMLFELVVSVVLLSFAVTSIAGVRTQVEREQSWATGHACDLAELHRALDRLVLDLRSATRVRIEAGTLQLQLPSGAVDYACDGRELVRSPARGQPTVLARCIEALELATDARTVRAGLTLRQRNAGSKRGPTVWITIAPRAGVIE